MKILFLGDIVGKPARNYLKEALFSIKKDLKADVVIANGENAAGGSSLTLETARNIFDAGVDIITSGDHIFKKQEAKVVVEQMDVLRPLNYSDYAPGNGYLIKEINGITIGVINLVGRVFMQPLNCPFNAVKKILEDIRIKTKIIIVDMHAEATSEKLAMGYYLAGKVSAVLGTHTHIPTADERVIDGSTAYISDVGMVGSFDSILGREKAHIIERFVTNMPVRFNLAEADVRIQGVIVEIDPTTGKALEIKRVEYKRDNQEGKL